MIETGLRDPEDLDAAALHVGALAVVTVLSLGLAWLGYRRDEGKTYG